MAGSHFTGPVYSKLGFEGQNWKTIAPQASATTDVSAAVNAAIAGGGVSLRFTRGTYSITSDITIPSNTYIVVDEGAVINCTAARWTGYLSSNVIFEINGTINALSYTSNAALNVRKGSWPQYVPAANVTAGSFVIGNYYQIATLGSGTNWTSIGASSATVGVAFSATGAGTGTGTALPLGASPRTTQNIRGFIELGGISSARASNIYVTGKGVVAGDWNTTTYSGWPLSQNLNPPNLLSLGYPYLWDVLYNKGIAIFDTDVANVDIKEIYGFAGEQVYYDSATGKDVTFEEIYSHDCNFNGLNFNVGTSTNMTMRNNTVKTALQCVELSDGTVQGNTLLNGWSTAITTGGGFVGTVIIDDNIIKGTPTGNYPLYLSAGSGSASIIASNNNIETVSAIQYNNVALTSGLTTYNAVNNTVTQSGTNKSRTYGTTGVVSDVNGQVAVKGYGGNDQVVLSNGINYFYDGSYNAGGYNNAPALTPYALSDTTNVVFMNQGAELQVTTAGITNPSVPNMLQKIITVSQTAAVTLQMPNGSTMDSNLVATFLGINQSFRWSVINIGSASGAVTMNFSANGAGHTYVGAATVAIGTSAEFVTRKTGTGTFTTYRIS